MYQHTTIGVGAKEAEQAGREEEVSCVQYGGNALTASSSTANVEPGANQNSHGGALASKAGSNPATQDDDCGVSLL